MLSTKVVKLLIIFLFYVDYYCCSALNNSFSSPQLRTGGWTPIPTKTSKLLSEKISTQITSDSMQTVVSSKAQTQQQQQQQQQQQKHQQKAEMLPIPVIKPHAHGATLGFNLPEQGLTLYLDINELATKPLAQNIGLKVVSHDSHQAQPSTQPVNHAKLLPTLDVLRQNNPSNKLYTNNGSPLSQFGNNMQVIDNSQKRVPITIAKIQKRVKASRNMGSYEGNAGSVGPSSTIKSVSPKYHVGYMRPMDLHNALKQVGLTHSNNQLKAQKQNSQTVIFSTNTDSNANNNNNNKATNERIEPKNVNTASLLDNNGFKPNPNKYFSTPVNYLPQINLNNNLGPETEFKPKLQTENRPVSNAAPQPSSYSLSSVQIQSKPSIQFPQQEKESQHPIQGPVQQTSQENDDFIDNEVAILTSTQLPVLPPQEEDVQQKISEEDNREITTKPIESSDENGFEEPQKLIGKEVDEEDDQNNQQSFLSAPPAISTPTTNAHFAPKDEDSMVKPFPPSQQDFRNTCPSVQTCQQQCAPNTDSLIADSSNIREIITQLNADSLINTFPTLEVELQNIIDFSSTNGYTIFLPSNNAISRLPRSLFEFWKNNVQTLTPLLDNHVLETAQSIEDMRVAEIIQPRSGGKLRVSRAHNDSYTVNGERIAIANQIGPSGGMIHVIDGILYPNSDKDIMETLKSCNRLDGFVTLAEGTGFSDTLKQSKFLIKILIIFSH